jgi:hypothetical protein
MINSFLSLTTAKKKTAMESEFGRLSECAPGLVRTTNLMLDSI